MLGTQNQKYSNSYLKHNVISHYILIKYYKNNEKIPDKKYFFLRSSNIAIGNFKQKPQNPKVS